MTDQQPEALRLAIEFEECIEIDAIPSINDVEKAAAELRRLHAENEALKKDAARYKWLREQHWSNNGMCVTARSENVRLGSFCPSGELLDSEIDAALAAQAKQGEQENG